MGLNIWEFQLAKKKAAEEYGGGNTGGEEWIGDGNTHLWISLVEGRTSPMLGVGVNGTVTVDWGDGSEPDVLTGNSLTNAVFTPNHQYARAGDYIVDLAIDGEMAFLGSVAYSHSYCIVDCNFTDIKQGFRYATALRRVEIGNGARLGRGAFRYKYGLERVKFAGDATDIGEDAFRECLALGSLSLSSIKTLGTKAFYGCSTVMSVTFDAGIASIGPDALYGFNGVRFVDFTKCNAVPTLGSSNSFYGASSDCEIRVPAVLAEEWKAATNWSTYASKIVGV